MPAARPGVGALVDEAAEAAGRGGAVFFEAPTGYGKTRAGPLLYLRLAEEEAAERVIHALPLRAIVEEAYSHYRESLPGASAGYQAHGLGLPGKSPFYAADAIVSTMDSLAFNLLRSSVGERGLGHYEVVRAHILSSAVVLDEAHLPLAQPGEPQAAALAALAEILSRLLVPVVVETATLPPQAAGELAERLGWGQEPSWVSVEPSGGWGQEPGPPRGVRRVRVEDPDYYEWALSLEWRYHPTPLQGIGEAVEYAAEKASGGLRVFLASTTVSGAIEAYERLASREGLEGRVALIHGRLASRDREGAVEAGKEALVVVGTSAVEAGVNIDADVVVTDAPGSGAGVAWESILQRLGRACRSPRRSCGEVHVALYGEGAGEALERLREPSPINPRIPYSYRGLDGYVPRLLDERGSVILEGLRGPGARRLTRALRELGLPAFISHERVEAIYRGICSPFRGSLLVPLIIPPRDWEPGPAGVEALLERLEEGWFLTVDAGSLLGPGGSWSGRARRWLYMEGGEALALTAEPGRGPYGHPGEVGARLEGVPPRGLDCERLARKPLLGLVAKPGAYREGVGLP
jgi:CRISPR-associated helicase Cas3